MDYKMFGITKSGEMVEVLAYGQPDAFVSLDDLFYIYRGDIAALERDFAKHLKMDLDWDIQIVPGNNKTKVIPYINMKYFWVEQWN